MVSFKNNSRRDTSGKKKKTELRNKGKIIRMSYKRNINTNLAS